MAEKYGLLPSEVMSRGTTFDLVCWDITSTWDLYQMNKAQGKDTKPPMSEEKLLDIIKRNKDETKGKRKS